MYIPTPNTQEPVFSPEVDSDIQDDMKKEPPQILHGTTAELGKPPVGDRGRQLFVVGSIGESLAMRPAA